MGERRISRKRNENIRTKLTVALVAKLLKNCCGLDTDIEYSLVEEKEVWNGTVGEK